MKSILLTLSQVVLHRFLVFCLMALLSLTGLVVFTNSPAYATTVEETQLVPPSYKPTNEQKIDRAYDMSEATGMLEETKQEIGNPNKNFDYNKKANTKTIVESDKAGSEPGIVEKAKEFVENIAK